MAELACRLTGSAHQVELRVGTAPPEEAPDVGPAPVADALDAFLAQGGSNIIVE